MALLSRVKGNCHEKVVILCALFLGYSFQLIGQGRPKQSTDTVRIKANGELTSRSIELHRRKFTYDDGGFTVCRTFTLWMSKNKDSDPCKEKVIRDFIWNHYSSKKRGYIRIKYIDIDSGSVEHFFIERGKNGRWAIIWWSIDHFSGGLPGSPRFKIWPKKFLTAQKVEDKKTGHSKLVFRTEDGMILQGQPPVLDEHRFP